MYALEKDFKQHRDRGGRRGNFIVIKIRGWDTGIILNLEQNKI